MFNIQFQDCIVRVDDLLEADDGAYSNFFVEQCSPCINGERNDILFVGPNEDDYHLDSLSIAIDVAASLPGIMTDLENNTRDTSPDIGCYEYQK